jgi:hypothetical protein
MIAAGGFFNDPEPASPIMAKALKYLEFGSVDDIYQDNALVAPRLTQNERMKEGQPVVVEEWHTMKHLL